jgi:hypothetical protein
MKFVETWKEYHENCLLVGIEPSIENFNKLLETIKFLKKQCNNSRTVEEYMTNCLLIGKIYKDTTEAHDDFKKIVEL